jgi:hypothetical protein
LISIVLNSNINCLRNEENDELQKEPNAKELATLGINKNLTF